jgi:ABC-type sugar transport system ATPase subunit
MAGRTGATAAAPGVARHRAIARAGAAASRRRRARSSELSRRHAACTKQRRRLERHMKDEALPRRMSIELSRPEADRALALELRAIDKRFGGVHALRGARLEVRGGEIMGLCGENGAGKSTLLKILSGVHPHGSYSGQVIVDGREQRLAGPADARRAGIAVVHQELTLVPELTVAQNLMLGREPGRFGFVDEARLAAQARRDLERFGVGDIDIDQPVQELGIGTQQIIEIVRALPQEARILVLDEPTAALTARETELLIGWLKSLRARGTTCIFVSHRLDEVCRLCDRVTVLRDGRTAATLVTAETTIDRIVTEMVGRPIGHTSQPRPAPPSASPPVLAVEGLTVYRAGSASETRPFVVEGVSLSLRPGEITAVCGANGSGRTALLSSLFGCARAGMSGRVRVDGVPVALDSPRAAIRARLAFLPEDRKGQGIVPFMTVGQNLALPSLASPSAMGRRAHVGLVDATAESRLARRRIRALDIRGDASASVVTLSGGNQQKVVLGKWLEQIPKVLLLDEPTRGVDVGAREEIYKILEELAQCGVAILFASSDLTEVLRLARRILVLRDGRLVGQLDAAEASQAAIVALSTGAARATAPSELV